MFFSPEKARQLIQKAGSTYLINYGEITIRMIPAAGLILYADYSDFPGIFKIMGWIMLLTSFILYFIPVKLHHEFALKSAAFLKPVYLKLISPLSVLYGSFLILSAI